MSSAFAVFGATVANGHAPLSNAELVPVDLTPVELLRIAVAQGADVDQLTKLMDLQDRWERRLAKRAYDAAMKAFKAESPRITKNSPRQLHHAEGHDRLSTRDARSRLRCGHRRAIKVWHLTPLEGRSGRRVDQGDLHPHARTGARRRNHLARLCRHDRQQNSIQAVGSTVTYLQRYTLLAATGLATSDSDDDGRGGQPIASRMKCTPIPEERIQKICAAIRKALNLTDLKTLYMKAGNEAKAANDRAALDDFIEAKDVRKKELSRAQ